MEKVNIEKFICSLIKNPKMPDEQTQALVEALHDQGLWYNDDTKEIDGIRHKYHEGQWLIYEKNGLRGMPFRIEHITLNNYLTQEQEENKNHQYNELAIDDLDTNKSVRPWTVQDAYAGQILRYPVEGEPESLFMFRQFNGKYIESVCSYWIRTKDLCLTIRPNEAEAMDDDICPADWKLVEMFREKIADAGYKYNPETNALTRKANK